MRVTQPGGFEKVPFLGKGLGLVEVVAEAFQSVGAQEPTIYGIARVELY